MAEAESDVRLGEPGCRSDRGHAFVAQPAAAEIPAAVQAQIQQQMEQNNLLQDQLMVLDQQNKYYQQAYKASMNLVTY